jgi:glycine cleavage system H protein
VASRLRRPDVDTDRLTTPLRKVFLLSTVYRILRRDMANVPEGLYYSKDHEWLRVEGETGTVGITDHAQNSLGDVVYVELPKAGETFAAHDTFGSVESVKAVSELFLPVAGEVTEVNESLTDEPEKVNTDPYGDGWMLRVRLSNRGEVDGLLSAAEYEDYIGSLE